MMLDVGDVERIEQPSAEQVRHFLRFMPPKSPFVILSASDDSFIQARPHGESYRVEYHQNGRRQFVQMPFEQAVRLFEAFRTGDDSFHHAVAWSRLSVLNDPYHPAVLVVLALLLIAFAVFSIWRALK